MKIICLILYVFDSECLCCFSERFYLVVGEEENGDVSVHSEGELQEGQRIVGSECFVRFGRRLYAGRIASVGSGIIRDWNHRVLPLAVLFKTPAGKQ